MIARWRNSLWTVLCTIAEYNAQLLSEARAEGRVVVMLAGRPYHSDALIQHKVSEMIAAQGAYVLSDDLARGKDINLSQSHYLSQWTFPNHIIRSAMWTAQQSNDVQFMQLTSFGCGPDAFLVDEVQAILHRHGKSLTLLKIDDVNNIGSLKLRVRSLIENLRLRNQQKSNHEVCPSETLPPYTKEHRQRKILIPFFTPFISPLLPSLVRLAGYDAENLPMSDEQSAAWGLKYSNNEVCYPATLIVGDIVKAFRSGAYNPDECCVAITQTGGQCRASNYLSLIRKALIENGYTNTPVISISLGSGISNNQPGFKINWLKMIPMAIEAVVYSDSISKMFFATISRADNPQLVCQLKDAYLEMAAKAIEAGEKEELNDLLEQASIEFNDLCNDTSCQKVGVVGEIFLKYNPFAQKHLVRWLIEKKLEVVYPALSDFFLQSFVNVKVNKAAHVEKSMLPDFLIDFCYKRVKKAIDRASIACKHFKRFVPFDDIFQKAEHASQTITLNAQFGEGWLIAGEVATMASQGVSHVVSLQPFGCIANQIVEKGIENRLQKLYPQMKILSLDFDSSVSDVNITNRLLLFVNNII